MKYLIIILIAMASKCQAMSVNGNNVIAPVNTFVAVIDSYLKTNSQKPQMPSPEVLQGDTQIVANDMGKVWLEVGEVAFFFERLAKSGEVIAIIPIPHEPSLNPPPDLRCVITKDESGKWIVSESKVVADGISRGPRLAMSEPN